MTETKFRSFEGLSTIKVAWNGDNIDGQARDVLFEGKVYNDHVYSMMWQYIYDLARQDGYIIDGWREVPFSDVVKNHQSDIESFLRQQKASVTKDSNIDYYNWVVYGKITINGKEF